MQIELGGALFPKNTLLIYTCGPVGRDKRIGGRNDAFEPRNSASPRCGAGLFDVASMSLRRMTARNVQTDAHEQTPWASVCSSMRKTNMNGMFLREQPKLRAQVKRNERADAHGVASAILLTNVWPAENNAQARRK